MVVCWRHQSHRPRQLREICLLLFLPGGHAQVAPALLARRTASNVPALTGLELVHFQNVRGHGLAVFYSRSTFGSRSEPKSVVIAASCWITGGAGSDIIDGGAGRDLLGHSHQYHRCEQHCTDDHGSSLGLGPLALCKGQNSATHHSRFTAGPRLFHGRVEE
jgi:hypothetical protein